MTEAMAVPVLIEAGFAIGVLGFMWKISSDSNRKANTVFKKFDEHKAHVEDKLITDYVSKEMCHLMHNSGLRDFERLERKVDEGFLNIDKKITALMNHKD